MAGKTSDDEENATGPSVEAVLQTPPGNGS